MTIIEIREVKRTWKLLRNINPSIVADAFYSKLFLEHPRLRSMFPKDMDEQYDKLITMLSKIVARLDNLENIQQEVVDMGERHKSYGVVETLRYGGRSPCSGPLKKGWEMTGIEEAANAWSKCYGLLAAEMMG
ncbi:MAG: globin domain-containing protein [Saprospiraceae bacterium]